MIDTSLQELVIALFALGIGGSSGIYGKYLLDKRSKTNGENQKTFLTEDKFIHAREACRQEVLTKLNNLDQAIRGDGLVDSKPGLVSTVNAISKAQQDMARTIEEIRTHQKNGGK